MHVCVCAHASVKARLVCGVTGYTGMHISALRPLSAISSFEFSLHPARDARPSEGPRLFVAKTSPDLHSRSKDLDV